MKRANDLPVSNLRALLVPGIILLSVTLIDQITKIWAVSFLPDKGSLEVLGQFLMLTLIYNEGGALGTSFGPSFYYLATSSLILAFVLYYIFVNRTNRVMAFPLALIAGGALGNIIDRIRIGKVVDWIDVDFFDLNFFGYQLDRWWTFNIADAAISCSIMYLLITMLIAKSSYSQHREKFNPVDSEKTPPANTE
ncbi:MAG: signal peptidase II [Candidatus Zixiibacteriota bacterium]